MEIVGYTFVSPTCRIGGIDSLSRCVHLYCSVSAGDTAFKVLSFDFEIAVGHYIEVCAEKPMIGRLSITWWSRKNIYHVVTI
jgi:hypothetical protein